MSLPNRNLVTTLLPIMLMLGACTLSHTRPPVPEGAGSDWDHPYRTILTICDKLWSEAESLTIDQARSCASALRRAYMLHDYELSKGRSRLDHTILAIATAGVATATFGAHMDTTAALGLAGGAVGGFRSYYNVNGRLQAMTIGRTGMNCILESSGSAQVQLRRFASLLQPLAEVERKKLFGVIALSDFGPVSDQDQREPKVMAMGQGASISSSNDRLADFIRQAIHRVSEQVIAAYTFGSVDFTSAGTEIRKAVDAAVAMERMSAVEPQECVDTDEATGQDCATKRAGARSDLDSAKQVLRDATVDLAKLNSCGRNAG